MNEKYNLIEIQSFLQKLRDQNSNSLDSRKDCFYSQRFINFMKQEEILILKNFLKNLGKCVKDHQFNQINSLIEDLNSQEIWYQDLKKLISLLFETRTLQLKNENYDILFNLLTIYFSEDAFLDDTIVIFQQFETIQQFLKFISNTEYSKVLTSLNYTDQYLVRLKDISEKAIQQDILLCNISPMHQLINNTFVKNLVLFKSQKDLIFATIKDSFCALNKSKEADLKVQERITHPLTKQQILAYEESILLIAENFGLLPSQEVFFQNLYFYFYDLSSLKCTKTQIEFIIKTKKFEQQLFDLYQFENITQEINRKRLFQCDLRLQYVDEPLEKREHNRLLFFYFVVSQVDVSVVDKMLRNYEYELLAKGQLQNRRLVPIYHRLENKKFLLEMDAAIYLAQYLGLLDLVTIFDRSIVVNEEDVIGIQISFETAKFLYEVPMIRAVCDNLMQGGEFGPADCDIIQNHILERISTIERPKVISLKTEIEMDVCAPHFLNLQNYNGFLAQLLCLKIYQCFSKIVQEKKNAMWATKKIKSLDLNPQVSDIKTYVPTDYSNICRHIQLSREKLVIIGCILVFRDHLLPTNEIQQLSSTVIKDQEFVQFFTTFVNPTIEDAERDIIYQQILKPSNLEFTTQQAECFLITFKELILKHIHVIYEYIEQFKPKSFLQLVKFVFREFPEIFRQIYLPFINQIEQQKICEIDNDVRQREQFKQLQFHQLCLQCYLDNLITFQQLQQKFSQLQLVEETQYGTNFACMIRNLKNEKEALQNHCSPPYFFTLCTTSQLTKFLQFFAFVLCQPQLEPLVNSIFTDRLGIVDELKLGKFGQRTVQVVNDSVINALEYFEPLELKLHILEYLKYIIKSTNFTSFELLEYFKYAQDPQEYIIRMLSPELRLWHQLLHPFGVMLPLYEERLGLQNGALMSRLVEKSYKASSRSSQLGQFKKSGFLRIGK